MALEKRVCRRKRAKADGRTETGILVTLHSRGGQVVRVTKESDRQFLELCDQFLLEAARILAEPPGRRR